MKKSSIPIIYYHSVADHEKQHPWAFLSVRIDIFKSQMKMLKIFGYNTCNWREFYEHSQGIKSLPKKTVFIHFDDGFLDNWTWRTNWNNPHRNRFQQRNGQSFKIKKSYLPMVLF